MSELRLNTSLETLEQLHDLADSKAKAVGVAPETLKLLLIDHSNLVRELKSRTSLKLIEPRHRERL